MSVSSKCLLTGIGVLAGVLIGSALGRGDHQKTTSRSGRESRQLASKKPLEIVPGKGLAMASQTLAGQPASAQTAVQPRALSQAELAKLPLGILIEQTGERWSALFDLNEERLPYAQFEEGKKLLEDVKRLGDHHLTNELFGFVEFQTVKGRVEVRVSKNSVHRPAEDTNGLTLEERMSHGGCFPIWATFKLVPGPGGGETVEHKQWHMSCGFIAVRDGLPWTTVHVDESYSRHFGHFFSFEFPMNGLSSKVELVPDDEGHQPIPAQMKWWVQQVAPKPGEL